jgi:hypothetical protein
VDFDGLPDVFVCAAGSNRLFRSGGAEGLAAGVVKDIAVDFKVVDGLALCTDVGIGDLDLDGRCVLQAFVHLSLCVQRCVWDLACVGCVSGSNSHVSLSLLCVGCVSGSNSHVSLSLLCVWCGGARLWSR